MADKLLSRSTVEEKTLTGRSSIYAGVKDGTFPKPVKIGKRSVAWLESEVDAWIEARIKASRPMNTKTMPNPFVTIQELLSDEFEAASGLLQHHLSQVENTYGLPRSITRPFGKSTLGLGRCHFHDDGSYTPDPTGEKAFLIAETMSGILPQKIFIAEFHDIYALPFSQLELCYFRIGRSRILGYENLLIQHQHTPHYRTAFDWLMNGGDGVYLLDHLGHDEFLPSQAYRISAPLTEHNIRRTS